MARRWIQAICVLASTCWLSASVMAQELDLEVFSASPRHQPEGQALPPSLPAPSTATKMPSVGKPLSATITKTLYLPPAMYGYWSVTGTLAETNAREFYSPVLNEVWILQRVGDQVMISNPATGASAAINVHKVEGDQATFHRQGPAGRNRFYQETPTITVNGDTLYGQSLNKILFVKNGRLNREVYAIYQLNATRISGARTQFRPESTVRGPDIQIEDIR